MPFLLAEILNFQGSTHRIGVGSFSNEINTLICKRICAILLFKQESGDILKIYVYWWG